MMSKFTQMYNFIVSIARSKTLLSWVSFYFIIAFDCFLLYLNIIEKSIAYPTFALDFDPFSDKFLVVGALVSDGQCLVFVDIN